MRKCVRSQLHLSSRIISCGDNVYIKNSTMLIVISFEGEWTVSSTYSYLLYVSIDSTKLSVVCAFNLHNFVADFLSVTVQSCRITTSNKKTQETKNFYSSFLTFAIIGLTAVSFIIVGVCIITLMLDNRLLVSRAI